MKNACLKYIFAILVIFLISGVYASTYKFKDYSNSNEVYSAQFNNFNDDNNLSQSSTTGSSVKSLSSNLNTITLLNPESGYYYITDKMLLWITTANPSTCTYTFNGETKDMIDNETDHYEYILGITDNMASDQPYVVDFHCDDGSSTTSTSTYFWINTTELDKYFFRSKLGDWDYLNSEDYYDENDSYALDSFRSLYQKSAGLYDSVVVKVYDSKASMEKYIDSNNETIRTIGNKNFFVYNETDINAIAWTSGNYLIIDIALAYQNTTPVNLDIPDEILNPYLSKYPNDLRNGVCGNGKIDIFNLDGKKEDCDKNSETISCGSNIGECKLGQKKRLCKSDCTWSNWGVCNATQAKTELCDGKDNNCNGQIDEGFDKGVNCSIGVGECKSEGIKTCSINGNTTICNAIQKNATQEICDNKDNDCDNQIDEENVCNQINISTNFLLINNPSPGVYDNGRLSLSLNSNVIFNKIDYIDYSEKKPRWNTLCVNCKTYNKLKRFDDGNHNLTFIGIMTGGKNITNKTSFIIDSKDPQISITKPSSRKYTNGSGFYIKYSEDNCQILKILINGKEILSNPCESGKNIEKVIPLDISSFNGQEVEYKFTISDIAGNTDESRPIKIKVDTTAPEIKDLTALVSGRYANFNMKILNENKDSFDKVEYKDNSDSKPSWKSWCTSLKNGVCEKKLSFKSGYHNIIVRALDEAGNSATQPLSFTI